MSSKKPKAPTKTELYTALSEKTGLTKKQIGSVLDELESFIQVQLAKKGPGLFVLPGLLKIKRHLRPATKERVGPNPRKPGETMTYPAKPARLVVKALPLKKLKDMVK